LEAVAAQVVDDLAVEAGDGDGLVEGEVEGVVDRLFFRRVQEGGVLRFGEMETAQDGLNVGADDADKCALRGSKYLAVQGDPPFLALRGVGLTTWYKLARSSFAGGYDAEFPA
jgi:hypothetical protein